MKKIVFVLLVFSTLQTVCSSQSSSIAKHWNEFTLEAIRNDLARPTVHARNLFHLSVLMYDAWAVYDTQAETYFLGKNLYGFTCAFNGIPVPTDIQAAREEAISHAAFSFLRIRYSFSPDYFNLLVDLQNEMLALGYNPFNNSTNYSSGDPAALGNYIASCMNTYAFTDGANQASNYGNNYYSPVNPPMDLTLPGNSTLANFNRWQPLAFQIFIDQSGNPIPGGTPPFLSPEWGNVNPFAFTAADRTTYTRDGNDYNVYCDPGPPPLMTPDENDDYKWGFSMVSIWASHLDPDDGVMIDISPGALGNLPVSSYPTTWADYRNFYNYTTGGVQGSNGHALNPTTGQPYQPNVVKRGDYTRILAEFWADGPDSETPPGHWFTILNYVLDHPQFTRDYRGTTPLGQLEYDVKAYFLLGAAMHDAAITAWGIKGWYDYIRPVSAIRGMAEAGQSSDPNLPNYSTNGIPLVQNYIELVEVGDPLAGASNEHVNKIKLYTWKGHDFIVDPLTDYAGVDWILAENWFPYQRPTFVTPNFAGYVSGHSTYSRAAAEVLTTLTGDAFFPAGIGIFNTVQNEFLVFEEGPTEDVTLEWATYRDASDQTSLSRIWGGIHPPADDIKGRLCGIEIADKVFNLAEQYFFPTNLIEIACPDDIIISNDPSLCGAVVPLPEPVITGLFDDYSTMGELTIYPVGETTITYIVTETTGASSASCSFTITVEDSEAPMAVCQDVIVELNTDGNAIIDASLIDNGSTDNCMGNLIFSLSQTDFSCMDLVNGAETILPITLMVTDDIGSIGSCIANITLVDNIAPIVACQDIIVGLDENGEAIITADMLDNGSTDNCMGALTFSLSQSVFSCDDLAGPVAVTLTVTDASNNFSTCIANVTIEDNIPPMLNCPIDNVIQLGASECGVNFSFIESASDNCGIDPIVTQISGPVLGEYLTYADSPYSYEFSATDASGNVTTCSFEIELLEYVPSSGTLSCNDLLNISMDQNCEALITAEMLLVGLDYACPGNYIISSTSGGTSVSASYGSGNSLLFTADESGGTFDVMITDPITGISCWSTVVLEDKIDPSLSCNCETPYLTDGVTPNPDCTFSCFEIWDLELLEEPGRNNELLPDADDILPTENCIDFGFPTYKITYNDGPNCGEQIVSRELLWTYVDLSGTVQYLSCVQNYLFDNLDINSIGSTSNGAWDGYADIFTANAGDRPINNIYTPEPIVYLSCGADPSPEGIVQAYDIDTPGRPAGIDRDDHAQTPNIIEHNEGYAYAYPYVVQAGWAGRFHAKPIDNNVCNIYTVFTDLTYDTCSEDCFGNSKVARSWTILDWCTASTVEFVQTIKRVDQEGPAVSAPDVTISVDPWSCSANYLVPAPEHLMDNCDKDPTWTIQTSSGVIYENGYLIELEKGTHQYTYEAADCCGNISLFTVNILVEDRAAPTAIALQNIVIQLTSIEDQDGIAKLYAIDLDNQSHDGCTPVHFEVRRDGNDWCNPGSNTSFNNDGHIDDIETDIDEGAFVMFCCEDAIDIDENGVAFGLHNVVLRVWDDGDMDGIFGSTGDNYNETWTTVRVEDKLSATVVCPTHIELSCEEDYLDYELTGRPYGFKACGDIECDGEPSDNFRRKPANSPPFVGEEIAAYNPSCRRGAIQRTWSCEGKTCTQWIIMRDTEDGELDIKWPEDQTLNCLQEENSEPIVVERLCELTGTSLQSDTFNFEDGACYKILNHWTVINWCDYDADDTDLNEAIDDEDDGVIPGYYTHTQVIKLIDTEKPSLSLIDTCFAVNSDCVGENLSIWASASDNGICASAWIKWIVEVDMYSDWEVDYVYNSNLPIDDDFYVAPTGIDGNESVHISLPNGLSNGCSSSHRVRWTALDGCGNETAGTSFFTIEDKKKPTPYMLNLSTALMENGEVELWANDFDAGSFDNCSTQDFLYYTFSANVPPQLVDPSEEDPWYDAEGVASQNDFNNGQAEAWNSSTGSSAKVFNQDDLAAQESNGGTLPISIYVWDMCGNFDHASVNLKLVDNGGNASANISGRVANEDGVGIPGVTLSAFSEGLNYYQEIETIEEGEYMFEFNPLNTDYELIGNKNDDWLNGVSTLDLVLIQRHILSISKLDSPFKLIAADINNDQKISAIDLIELRKLILGIYSELPNNESWRFTDASVAMNENQPWPFDDGIYITDFQTELSEENFIGIKIGEVDGNINFLEDNQTDNRSIGSLNIIVEELKHENGVTELIFSSDNFNEILGFQFALQANIFDLVDVEAHSLQFDMHNVAMTKEGLMISWNNNVPINQNGEPLFSIKLKKGNSNVKLSNDILNPEAYQGSELNTISIGLINQDGTESYLSQNEPNPWRTETYINFGLEKESNATITIFDINGETIYSESGFYKSGRIRLLASELGLNAGVLFYKLETDEFSKTRKMILIE